MARDFKGRIWQKSGLHGDKPCIKGTGVTVDRIVTWYKLGHTPKQIASQIEHISEEQVKNALEYYRENWDEIEASLESAEAEAITWERAAAEDAKKAG